MSDDRRVFSEAQGHPIARARTVLERRGAELPEVALRALAREVILRIAKRPAVSSEPNPQWPTDEAVALLCDALVSPDEQQAANVVRAARLGGMSTEALYFGFIAKAVALLGTRWEQDLLTVSDVIIGAGRVYGILRELRTVFLAERLPHTPGATAVFAQVPGEIHTIGVTMAADAMRRRGWEIDLRLGLGHDALVSEIGRLQPAIIGLSASTRQQTFSLARLIVALRICCPQVWILVAGQIAEQDAHLRDLVDADAVAATMDEAAAALDAHLRELTEMSQRRG